MINRPTDDLDIGEIQHTVSQSELIEPLGARTNLTKLAFTLRCHKPPSEAGTADLPDLTDLLQQLTNQPLNFNLLQKGLLAQI